MKRFGKLLFFITIGLLLTACSAQSSSQSSSNSKKQVDTSHSTQVSSNNIEGKASKKTLVIVSHPNYQSSTFTKGLAEAAAGLDNVTMRNIDELYGTDTSAIDTTAETELMEAADRVVFIFPTYWFNVTPMMKAYLDAVWGGVGPNRWEGKELLVVSRAGGDSSVYGENGSIGHHLKDVFVPLEASAHYAGMTYLEPLTFEGGSSSDLPSYQEQLVKRLQE